MRFFWGIKIPKAMLFSAALNTRMPFICFGIQSNPQKSMGVIRSRPALILKVDRARDIAKILYCVIGATSVNMVNITKG